MGAYAKDKRGESLLQLSEEVSRIAGTLAQLSTTPSLTKAEPAARPLCEVSARTVGSIIRARRLRGRYFSEDLFADPVWDMMLELLHTEVCQTRITVSSLCLAAAVPATTALRWLKLMEKDRLVVRRSDPHDGRRVFVELTPDTSLALHQYFAEVEQPTMI